MLNNLFLFSYTTKLRKLFSVLSGYVEICKYM